MKTSFVFIVLAVVFSLQTWAQLITTDPAFPQSNQSVTIYFNAAEGSKGLKGYTGDVYAHTGVITDKSTSGSDWKYVKTQWGQNTPETKLTRISNDYYKLVISPSIRSFYGVPANETIKKMAFVFRSASQVNGQWLEGKTADFGDIFVDVFQPGLNVYFETPTEYSLILEPGDTLIIKAVATGADTLDLYMNQVLKKEVIGANAVTDTVIVQNAGKYRIKVIARGGGESKSDEFVYFVRTSPTIASLPDGVHDGINVLNDSTVTLVLYAPGKSYAFAMGDFNNWEPGPDNYMNLTPDGNRFWVTITGLTPGTDYAFQYWVDGTIKIGDPYCELVLDPWNDKYIDSATFPGLKPYPEGKTTGIVSVLNTSPPAYQWTNTQFNAPDKADLIIYELLVRDFTSAHNYQAIIDTLGYLKRLGINAIELMPVNEFDGNSSWGYNPAYYFAPDKYYGTKNKLKELIDSCHSLGIAVILDMVLNHSFGQSPLVKLYWDAKNNRPAADNPWYNPVPRHDFNVGYDFNHESAATQFFVDSVVKFWLAEYKVDGYRFDLSKGFTQKNTLGNAAAWGQYDASRIAILKRIADAMWSVNPRAYAILEHFTENSEEKELSDYGLMPWGNMNHAYGEASMGWVQGSNSDLSWGYYKNRGWSKPHLVSYMESHDEERMMFRNLKYGNSGNPSYNIKDTAVALKRVALSAAFFFTIPGPKMIYQFEELGYDYSIDYNGRLGEKPPAWHYLQDPARNDLFKIFSALAHLKTSWKVFQSTNVSADLSGAQKRINLVHPDLSVTVIGNFDIYGASVNPQFTFPGRWYDFISGDSISVSNTSDPIYLEPGEFRIYTSKNISGNLSLLSTNKKLITLDYTQNSQDTFQIQSNISWSINYQAGWLQVQPVSGKNNKKITVKALSENKSTQPRSAVLQIVGAGVQAVTVKVIQNAQPLFELEKDTVYLDSLANSSTQVKITTNLSWTAKSSQSWCLFSPSSGQGDTTIKIVSASPNKTGKARVSQITFTTQELGDKILTVVQSSFPTSVEEKPVPLFTLYPSPSSGLIYVRFSEKITGTFSILNLQGQTIYKTRVREQGLRLDLSSLPDGIYIARLNTDKRIYYARFIKK